MSVAVLQSIDATAAETEQDLTDGFHLMIDPLKLNDINTIYGVPGIPITDFGRMAQGAGIRVISFRHEQNAGNAAAIAGFLTKKPGVCLTESAPVRSSPAGRAMRNPRSLRWRARAFVCLLRRRVLGRR